MPTQILRCLTLRLWKAFVLVSLLTVECRNTDTSCTTRRCLAEMLINRNYSSQPQQECLHTVSVPLIEYQTLAVDTKKLRLRSRLQASLVWTDPELAWNTSVYPYDTVVLPVSKVWTPELQVTNGILTTMKHSSQDLLAYSNGTLKHNVIINAEVNCEVNLFNYPFASDECPVAIQSWALDDCGTQLEFGDVMMIDGNHGDWQTDGVELLRQGMRADRNYIMVALTIRYLNPFVTLMLPSILILLADMVSFALPLGGGERNSFKVTLVLSFTMFLIILNNELPGDSKCSPIIRTHFCVCLVLLVLSMLVSMVLTRLAKDGSLMFCCCPKRPAPKNTENKQEEEEEDEEAKADGSDTMKALEDEVGMLRKVVNFLEELDAKALERERFASFANKLDQTFFWIYLFLGSAYFVAMIVVMVKYRCEVNHFDFWY